MKKRKLGSQIIAGVILLILSIIFILPFCVVISTSFSSQQGIATYGYSIIPREFNLDSYSYVVKNLGNILNSYAMSIGVTLFGTLLGITIMCLFAYPISRPDFKFKNQLSFFAYFTMLFSGGAVSQYIWFTRGLGLLNNPAVLVLPMMVSAWNIFILRTGFRSTSMSLIEAAKIEGCGEFRTFISIVLPIQKTIIATVALLMIFAYWNEWYLSMMYMDTSERTTIQYYLVRILNNVNFVKNNSGMSGAVNTYDLPSEGVQMVICILAVGPMMLVFPFLQKYFVSGIQVGSVKG